MGVEARRLNATSSHLAEICSLQVCGDRRGESCRNAEETVYDDTDIDISEFQHYIIIIAIIQ